MSSKRVRRPIRHRSANARSLGALVERLESRELLSALPEARTSYVVMYPSANPGPTNSGYTPAQIQQAYGFNLVSNNGSGETIAIVDAYNDPNISSDLATFDDAYGLAAPPSFTVVNQSGGSTLPGNNASWGVEESLDVEWAHAMAPGAKILLVEASSATDTNLLDAVKYASSVAPVVSMSWGGSEFSGETADDGQYFSAPGVAYVAASGDSGAPAEWPAASPDVLGVGGTSLTLNSSGGWGSETGWSDSTGGPSAYESQPSYQNGVVTQTSTRRATPDVAYDADPNTGVAVYDSYGYSGWLEVGGTSAGAPQWSAIIAIADEGRSQPLATSGSQSVQSILYPNEGADFHDITSGNNGYAAGPGYDYVTGLGSPIVNAVVASLDGGTVAAPDTLVITGAPQGPVTAGTSFSITVTAETSTGQVDPNFAGTVSFTSTDGQAVLPARYTFTTGAGGDDGVHTFSVTLKTAGSQGITASDGSSSATAQVTVSPAAASQLVISGLSSTATAGSPLTFTVTAKDPFGNVATGYAGTVAFTSTDGQAVLPASYTFTTGAGGDDGVHNFTVTFNTVGTQTVTATDSGNNLSVTSGSVQVSTAAPPPSTESIWGTSYSPKVNAEYQGSRGQTFELGVQFESNIAGEVTGVLFYKQRGASGSNVGHLWSSSGALLASVTFTHETSSGWQEANFSNPVPIQADTFYTISYDTGSPLFYYESGYFSNGGVTNDNLTAPAYTTINGQVLDNGVYNYGGDFPVASQYQANFWVDVVFSPSAGSDASVKTAAISASTGGSGAVAIGQSGYAITSAASATPAGPMGVVPGSRGSSTSRAPRPSVSLAAVSGRPVVTQARPPVLWGPRATSSLS